MFRGKRAMLAVLLAVPLIWVAHAQEKTAASGIDTALRELHERYKGDTEGKYADCIPPLARRWNLHLFSMLPRKKPGE